MVHTYPVGTAACTLTAENGHAALANHRVLGLVPGLRRVHDPPPRFLSCPQLYPPPLLSKPPTPGRCVPGHETGRGRPCTEQAPPQRQAPLPLSPLQLESQSAESECWQSRKRGRDWETSPVWEGDARRPAFLKSTGAPGPSL